MIIRSMGSQADFYPTASSRDNVVSFFSLQQGQGQPRVSGFGTDSPAYAGAQVGGFYPTQETQATSWDGINSGNGSQYQQNIVNVANLIASGGWRFTGQALGVITGSSNHWTEVVGNGLSYLQIKSGSSPANAIRELFERPGSFSFDCATSTAVVLQKARLDTVGDAAFNELYSRTPLVLAGWQDPSGTDFSMKRNARFLEAGEVTLGGRRNLSGELAPFDASVGDQLSPGGVYYFERPGDTRTYNQGWNAIFMGKEGSLYKFWRVDDGMHYVDLREKNDLLIDAGGMYKNEYLSSSILTPNDISSRRQMAGGYPYAY